MKLIIPQEYLQAVRETSERKQAEFESLMKKKQAEFESGESSTPQGGLLKYEPAIVVREASDITSEMLPALTEMTDIFYSDSDTPIEWSDFADVLERDYGISLFDLDCPAFRKIQRIVKGLRQQD